MKRENRNAIKRGIEKSDTCGYKWTITPTGLKWGYLDVEFTFREDVSGEFLNILDPFGEQFACIWYADDECADCKTLEEAYEMAAIKTIRRANYLY